MRFSLPVILSIAVASPAAAQTTPPIHVPPLELAAGVSVEHSTAGAVAAISGNLSKTIAITSEIDESSGGATLLAGARVGTGFWYDGRPPLPGRFFAQLMAARSTVQAGVGADVIVLPRAGISLHWSGDYRWRSASSPERSGARLVVGILIGPRT